MAYTETCMENLLPAGAFMVGLVLDLGRQSPLVTAPTDGHLRALFLVLDPWGAGSYATSCPTNTPPRRSSKPFELRRSRALAGLFLRRKPPKVCIQNCLQLREVLWHELPGRTASDLKSVVPRAGVQPPHGAREITDFPSATVILESSSPQVA